MLTQPSEQTETKTKLSTKLAFTGIVIVCILIGSLIGSMFIHQITQTQKEPICPIIKNFSLNESDKNFLLNLSYNQGFCERQGLESSIFTQKDSNGKLYGIPICVERK